MGKTKIYSQVEGNTLDSHKKFLDKLRKKGAKVVADERESDATILFCPIVSRLETNITAALSAVSVPPENGKPLIVVAMHHTFNHNYPLPENGKMAAFPGVDLIVHCLFFSKQGLLKCPTNKKAKKQICEMLKISKWQPVNVKKRD